MPPCSKKNLRKMEKALGKGQIYARRRASKRLKGGLSKNFLGPQNGLPLPADDIDNREEEPSTPLLFLSLPFRR